MPKLKWCYKDSPPQEDPIDWDLAAILYRKYSRHLGWGDIAKEVGVTEAALRSMAFRKPPRDWPHDVRENTFRYLDIPYVAAHITGSPGEAGPRAGRP